MTTATQRFAAGDTVIIREGSLIGKIVACSRTGDRWGVRAVGREWTEWCTAEELINLRADTLKIIDDIIKEHTRRFEKWGEQDYPVSDYEVANSCLNLDGSGDVVSMLYSVPTEADAKRVCRNAFSAGDGTWFNVIVEELCEAIASTSKSRADLRGELVQLASVVIGAIESLDRNGR